MKIAQDAPRLPTLGLLFFLVLTVGCVIEPPTRPTGESTEIVLRIMGGIAGVEYTLRVDGTERILEGVSCASGCDFQAGETLAGLSPARIGELRDLALRAGLPTIGHQNYGTGCCDLFAYDLRFDLTPLHDEYDSSYEPGGPLVMHVQDPGGETPFRFELTWGDEGD